MARKNASNSMGRIRTSVEIDSVVFGVMTEKQIRKLCKTKVWSHISFDELGHPLPGGLYDTKLGPMGDRADPCGTCMKNALQCPGHFGYIELSLPVINPLFHKMVALVLRISCLSCYRVQVATEDKHGRPIEVEVTEQMLKEIKTKKKCLFCRKVLLRLETLHNKIMIKSFRSDGDESSDGPKLKVKEIISRFMTPTESKDHLRKIWKNDSNYVTLLAPVLARVEEKHPTDCFFMSVVPVPPPNARPVNFIDGRVVENQRSQMFKNIITNSHALHYIIKVMKYDGDVSKLNTKEQSYYNLHMPGKSATDKLNATWEALQLDVDNLCDKTSLRVPGEGLKQIIEKKQGLIRMHMMGKRVNYAARSVIAPDPTLNINEIGVPEEFAKRLTFPCTVTPWNVEELRKMVMNGPDVHPGATMVKFEDGRITRINPKDRIQQESLLKRLLTPHDGGRHPGLKTVYRHLVNGDVLLLNRQPTLHKPSIMAHNAKILKGDKVLRLHYANCKAYNADFDGDEMNAHFPQDLLSRSESQYLANVSNQFLVPKDGTPLMGLIQDHVIGGVKLSIRGKFFTKSEYNSLVYKALDNMTTSVTLLPPAILKPRVMWSGKQVISTVIINILPQGKERITLVDKSKVAVKNWQKVPPRPWKAGGTPFSDPNEMSEAQVVIRRGELLVGVLDKQHYGATPYGLAHCVHELYDQGGGDRAIKLLSAFGKLFIAVLQWEGFTLGIHDILVQEKANKRRRKIIREGLRIGHDCMTEALSMDRDATDEEIVEKLERVGVTNTKTRALIDKAYKSSLDACTNKINKVCLPAGLRCKFPENNLQLMVESGAKGSTVNTMQISCCLGQIELEGKRPPVMINGKSLPCYPTFEFSPRAGGYIPERFLSGILPQGFFHHCMAGREGLIDTACKTARSGYLQRCLVKNLEGLTVWSDNTVRDTDGTVIQFMYGEDGMDVSKAQFMDKKQMKFLFENRKVILDHDVLKRLKSDAQEQEAVKAYKKTYRDWCDKHGDDPKKLRETPFTLFSAKHKTEPSEVWSQMSDRRKDKYSKKVAPPCPDPIHCTTDFRPANTFGSINPRLENLGAEFCATLKSKKESKQFTDMLYLKGMQSLAESGEPVGLLAAQSIGEPSTQMTLNTFHFAGRGDMNVTLGIPRLREVLMMASKNIKTPWMEIPFLDGVVDLEAKAEGLRRKLTRVLVANVLEDVLVTVELSAEPPRQYIYTLCFRFLPHEYYEDEYAVRPKQILRHMEQKFFAEMFSTIKKISKVRSGVILSDDEMKAKKKRRDDDDEDEDVAAQSEAEAASDVDENDHDSSSDEFEDDEDAKARSKYQCDQEPEDEEMSSPDDESTEQIEGTNANDESPEGEAEQGETASSRNRKKRVLGKYSYSMDYVYDKKEHLWCTLKFSLPLIFKKLDMNEILREVAGKSVVWETQGIKRAITYLKKDKLTLRTDGINLFEIYKFGDLLDLKKLYCNDIHKVLETFGCLAASEVIIKEVKDVFEVYGIKVDERHLSLIASYMMRNGTFDAMNRKGMESSTSPLQQMTFESSLTFLKNAVIKGKRDNLDNPSSRLMLGKCIKAGTNSFSLIPGNLNIKPGVVFN